MFDILDLLSTTKDFPITAPDRDPTGLLKSLNGVIAKSAAAGVTLAPAATALLQIGDQLTQQDGGTGGEKKKGKTKKINKSNLSDEIIKAFYFNVALLFRLYIEEQRNNGRLTTIRTTTYSEVNGLTGILVVNFMDRFGVKYTYDSETQKVLTSAFKRVKGLIEVIKPDGTTVYLFGR